MVAVVLGFIVASDRGKESEIPETFTITVKYKELVSWFNSLHSLCKIRLGISFREKVYPSVFILLQFMEQVPIDQFSPRPGFQIEGLILKCHLVERGRKNRPVEDTWEVSR